MRALAPRHGPPQLGKPWPHRTPPHPACLALRTPHDELAPGLAVLKTTTDAPPSATRALVASRRSALTQPVGLGGNHVDQHRAGRDAASGGTRSISIRFAPFRAWERSRQRGRAAPRPKWLSMNQSAVAGVAQRGLPCWHAHLALAELTADDLASMLSENDTLFVEHEGGLERRRSRRCTRLRTRLAGGFSSASRTAPGTRASRGGWRPVRADGDDRSCARVPEGSHRPGFPVGPRDATGVPTDAPG
jgi:hypothetical protein